MCFGAVSTTFVWLHLHKTGRELDVALFQLKHMTIWSFEISVRNQSMKPVSVQQKKKKKNPMFVNGRRRSNLPSKYSTVCGIME
jgi:hypothetical protein